MKAVDLYYFSGTGNTLLVTRKMAETFEKKGIRVNLRKIEKENPKSVSPEDTLGLAFPVACQGTYPFIWDFIKSLPQKPGVGVFMVDTLAKFSGGVVGPIKKILEKKGYEAIGAEEIIMPSNRALSSGDYGHNDEKIREGLKNAEKYAESLIEGKAKWGRAPVLSDLMSKISLSAAAWNLMKKMLDLKLDKTKCVKCGQCLRLCPVNNIKMNDFPEFGDKCVSCLRCVAFCPKGAIFTTKKFYIGYKAVDAGDMLE